ncbi:MAG TPA: restriction endonuclease subunit S [Candidatus Kapabacteria bacterium]|nr:restriction endonuclease subunit S [Candidatus Kapabacteria bacterium]
MATLQPYQKYYPVAYDYASQLPEGWQLLPNIAIFQERKERGTENEETLSISAIRGIVKSSDYENRKDRTSDDKSQYLLVKEGDLAYNTMLMWDGAVGHSAFRGIVSPAYTVLKAKMKINPKYFHYQMRTEFYKNYSRRFSYGIVDARLRLYYVHFKRMYSIVPPLSVQNSIVAYLDKKSNEIDKFIRNKERLIELLEESRKIKIFDAITKGLNKNVELKESGIDWFGLVPKNWIVTRAKFVSKIFIPDRDKPDLNFEKDGIPWVTTEIIGAEILEKDNLSNYVSRRVFNTKENRVLPKNSIVATCVGSFGVSSFVPFDCFINQQIQAYTELKINPFYLRFIIQSSENYFIQNATQTTLMYVNKQKFSELPVLFPPIEEQEQIIAFIQNESSEINLAISKARREISVIKEFREALITDLVTGKRKVSEL